MSSFLDSVTLNTYMAIKQGTKDAISATKSGFVLTLFLLRILPKEVTASLGKNTYSFLSNRKITEILST